VQKHIIEQGRARDSGVEQRREKEGGGVQRGRQRDRQRDIER